MSKSTETPKLNLLIAYPYIKADVIQMLKEHEHKLRFVVDSGAFTAWKAGKPIALDDYCRFLENFPVKPWRYFTLDVIGDAEGTLKNYKTMLKRGFKPVPIFTRGEDPKLLDEYYETSDVVGIGGLVGTRGNKGFVKGIMKVVGTRKVHWLGFTNLNFLKVYKPYMADSSSWEMGGRYARTTVYAGNGQNLVVAKSDIKKIRAVSDDVVNAVQRLGLNPDLLMDPNAWQGGRGIARLIGAASGVKLSLDVERHLGTKLFMACATAYASELLVEAFDRIMERGKPKNESTRRLVRRNGQRHSISLGEAAP